ncbi:hypothetical protein Hanom_Chr11g01007381 [Helianthus anomalus]
MNVAKVNIGLWPCFFTPFTEALEEAKSNPVTLASLFEPDKKAFDLEKKAFWFLTQVLMKYIMHQFIFCTTTKN